MRPWLRPSIDTPQIFASVKVKRSHVRHAQIIHSSATVSRARTHTHTHTYQITLYCNRVWKGEVRSLRVTQVQSHFFACPHSFRWSRGIIKWRSLTTSLASHKRSIGRGWIGGEKGHFIAVLIVKMGLVFRSDYLIRRWPIFYLHWPFSTVLYMVKW